MRSTDAVNRAKAEIGVKEAPPNSNNVKYNTWYYGKEVSGSSYPWCATFISWLFKDEQSLCPKSASCENLYNWFKQRGQLVDDPQPGDIVFFKYTTSDKARNNRKTNHIGIVKMASSRLNVVTIEGNTSITSNDNGGCVMERVRKANIVGYARPKYSDSTTKATTVGTATSRPTLRLGSKGDDVTYLQLRLQVLKYNPGKADGDFGPKTLEAVKSFQKAYHLTVDGIVGPSTWAAIG